MTKSSSNFFFFNDTATTEIYTLSLHDALPIWVLNVGSCCASRRAGRKPATLVYGTTDSWLVRNCTNLTAASGLAHSLKIGRAHVELQSRQYLVCRLLLEKKKTP